jgi:uncharacterized protein YcfJ
MNRNTLKTMCLVTVVAFTLSGCATTQGGSTDVEETSQDTGRADRTRTRVEGAAFGALLGGLIGGLAGGDAKGALIGAGAGAAVGFIVGNEIARRKKQYATEEEFLNAEIKTAEEFNMTATEYNHQLRQHIAELDSSTTALMARYQQGVASKSEIEARRAEITTKIEESKQVEENLQKEYDVKVAVYEEQKAKRASDDTYLISLQKEIKQLDENIVALQTGSAELAEINDKLTT